MGAKGSGTTAPQAALVASRKMEPAWEKTAGLKFQLGSYKDANGQFRPCYSLTKDTLFSDICVLIRSFFGTYEYYIYLCTRSMERNKEIYEVTLIGGVVNVVLLVFKFVAGILGSHDYGHGKYETLAMTIIGMALLVVAIGIVYSGIEKIMVWARGGLLEAPGMLALWAALLSVVLKEGVYHYSMVKAKALNSQALEANAWHHRSDALSSIGTAVGIGGAILLGQRWTVLDPVASVIVGLFIVKVAIYLLRDGIGDLMEHSLPDEVEDEILRLAASVDGVTKPHELRTRRIGNHYAIELHILMDGDIPLREAHEKASEVEDLLRRQYGDETHVAVHVEPTTEYKS